MPLSVRRLRDAAFERYKKFASRKALAGRTSKDGDGITKLAALKAKLQLPDEDDSYDHVLPLLLIPAESDGNIPGMLPPEDASLHFDNVSGQEAPSRQHTRGLGSQGSDGRCSSKQQIDREKIGPADNEPAVEEEERQEESTVQGRINQKDLTQMANEALSVAAASGISLPWQEQCFEGKEKADLKEETTEDPLQKALALLGRLQAWEVFANADLEHQNRLLRFFGLPTMEADDEA